MGLLLMQYEYQRAKQKATVYELRSIRLHDKQEQYTKRIADIEKIFTKKKTSLDNAWNTRMQSVTAAINAARLSETNLLNLPGALSGIIDSKVLAGVGITSSNLSISVEDTGNETQKASAVAAALAAKASEVQVAITTLIENLKQSQLDQLEAMEDRQREPIAEKDAEIQADVAEVDTLLELAKEREEAAKGRLPQTVKGSVAHYGLS